MLDPRRTSTAATGPCERIVERAHEWLDGELAPPAAARLRAHLADCPACARAVAAEARFVRVLRARAHIERAPAALRDRVRGLLRARG